MIVLSVIIFAILINNIKTSCDVSRTLPIEYQLHKKVFCDYDSSIRPVINHKNSTRVMVRMVLKTISYSEHGDTITINSWMVLTWKDEHLNWKPADYNNIDVIQVSSSNLWLPELSLYNSENPQSGFVTSCLLYSYGRVVCVPPMSHSALCSPDVTRWPFDVQNCTLRLGSWVHTGEEVDYQIQADKAISIDDYLENRDWHLKHVNVTRHHGKFSCCPNDTFPSLRYNFIIERHSGTLAAQIVIPAIVMVLINLVAMWIDSSCGERIFLICVNFICHFSFTQQLSWHVPSNGDTCPLVVLFFRDSLFITTFILIITVITRRLNKRTNEPWVWIVTPVNYLLSSKLGQLLVLNDLDPKAIASEIDGGNEDGASLVITKHNESLQPKEWRFLAIFIDRIAFFAIFVTYASLMLALIPGSY